MIGNAEISGLVKLCCPDVRSVILASQDVKRPERPYATFKLGAETGIGFPLRIYKDSVDFPTEKITETVQRVKKLTVEINFFTQTESQIIKEKPDCRKVARELCNEFLERLYLVSAQDFMTDNGFSLLDTKDFSDIGLYLGDKHERRAICELTINYVGEVFEDIPFIEKQDDSSITGTYVDAAGNTL
jgi:hypothetical protein